MTAIETAAELDSERVAVSPAGKLLRFAMIGALGFFVDAGVLWLATGYLSADLYSGRVASYLAAATFTWALNRHFTFLHASRRRAFFQWLRFLGVNLGGGVVNYSTYALLITFTPLKEMPLWLGPTIAVGVGSLAGLVVNFTASSRFVFSK